MIWRCCISLRCISIHSQWRNQFQHRLLADAWRIVVERSIVYHPITQKINGDIPNMGAHYGVLIFIDLKSYSNPPPLLQPFSIALPGVWWSWVTWWNPSHKCWWKPMETPMTWWLRKNPSEKYESQLGMMIFPIYGTIIKMFQTTNQPMTWWKTPWKPHENPMSRGSRGTSIIGPGIPLPWRQLCDEFVQNWGVPL